MKHLITLSCASMLAIGSLQAQKALILQSPDVQIEYQVTSLSPNGKWACGIVNDGYSRAFRWNLTSGEFVELSPMGVESIALGVANDGTVAGSFTDSQYLGNGASIQAAGYYRNGQWHHLNSNGLSAPTDDTAGSQANAISPDGNLVGGIALLDGRYSPVVWNISTGTMTPYVFKNAEMNDGAQNSAGSIMAVSNDGKAAGWVYRTTKSNRTPCLWTTPNDSILPSFGSVGPYCYANSISSDGKQALAYDRVYNFDSRTSTEIASFNNYYGYFFFNINAQGTVAGYVQKGPDSAAEAVVNKGGQVTTISSLLGEAGVDLSKYPYLLQAVGVSDDEQTYLLMAYDSNQVPRAIAVRLNQNVETPAPVALKAKGLDGAGSVELTWHAPLANASAVTGYDVYREGVKINSTPVTQTYYVDTQLANGTYHYTVKSLYANNVAGDESEQAVATVSAVAQQAPGDLVAVQRGYNNVRLLWQAPRPALSSFSYVDSVADIYSFGGGTYSFENGVRLRASLLNAYAQRGDKLTGICFYPMTKQEKWTLNVYDADNATTPLYTQDIDASSLNYGVENTVTLDTPFELPADKDLILGLAVTVNNGGSNVVGLTFSNCVPGYTDLIRRPGENETEFYSLYDRAQESEQGAYMYESAWPITALFGADKHSADVKSYNLYVNGEKSQSVSATDVALNNVADGDYTYGVSAVNAAGAESAQAQTQLTVKGNEEAYKPVNLVANVSGNKLTATWQTPLNDNSSFLTYATGNVKAGPTGSFIAKATYSRDVTRTYDGYQIKSLRFYPTADAEFTLYLEKDGETVASVPVDSYELNQWNEVELDEPVTLSVGSEYGLVLDCYDVLDGEAPLAIDDQWGHQGISNLCSTDNGDSYSSLNGAGNWMLGMVLGTADAEALPIDGYKVLIDGKQANDQLVSEPSYTQTFDDAKATTHRLQVTTVYAASSVNASSKVIYFTINPTTGIGDVTTDGTLRVSQGATHLKVEGVNVKQLSLYSADGALVAQAGAATLPVASLPKGVYVLVISTTEGRTYNQKVQL